MDAVAATAAHAGFHPTRRARSDAAAEVDPAQLCAPRQLGHLASILSRSATF